MPITSASFMKQNLFGFLAQSLGLVSNLIFNILFPIFLGATMFGELSLSLGFAYFLVGLFDTGFNNTCMRFISKYKGQNKKGELLYSFKFLFELKMIFAFFLSALLFISSFWLSKVYEIPLISLQVVSLLIFFYSLLTFLMAFFTAFQKNKFTLLGTIINSSFLIILPLLAYFMGFALTGIIIAVIISFAIASSVLYFISMKNLNSIKVKPKKVNKKQFYSNIVEFSTVSISTIFIYWGILLILGFFEPASEVAFFKISVSWVLAVVSFVPVSAAVIFSAFVNLNESNKKALTNYIKKTFKYGFSLITPMMFGIFLLGPKMIQVIYGAEFARASLPLIIICWAILPLFANNILFSILVAFNKLKEVSKIYLSTTVISLIATILFCSRMGLQGAAFSFVFVNYLILLFSLKYYGQVKESLYSLIKPLIASVAMSAFVYTQLGIARTINGGLTLIFMGAVVYFIALYLIKGIDKEDLKVLKLLRK